MHAIQSIQAALEIWSSKADQDISSPERVLDRFLEVFGTREDIKRAIILVERLRSLSLNPNDIETLVWICSSPKSHDVDTSNKLVAELKPLRVESIRSVVRNKDTYSFPFLIEGDDVACIFYFQRCNVFKQIAIHLIGVPEIATAAFRDAAYAAILSKLPMLEANLLLSSVFVNYPKRIEFHRRLLATQTSDVAVALTSIAASWKYATGSDWVWIWMHNGDGRQWEFLACDEESSVARLPPHISHEADRGILSYAWLKQRPITDVSPLTWLGTDGDQVYEVVDKEEIAGLGCCVLDCVPCIGPKNHSARVGISLHYSNPNTKIYHPVDSMATMGSVTGGLIHNIFSKQQSVLESQLNRIAATVLASGQYKPGPALEKYCEEVISLIKKHVRVDRVSLFYRNWNEDSLSCIASTGLFDPDGIQIPQRELMKCTYNKGESLTGGVFQFGEPYVSIIKPLEAPHKHLFTEIAPTERENSFAFALYPILLTPPDENSNIVRGVIRCVNPRPTFTAFANESKNFDIFQLEAIQFVGRQIGVALEILLAFKAREKHISSIKHDINAPLQGIRDLVGRIPVSLSERQKPQTLTEFALDNYKAIVTLISEIEEKSTSEIMLSPQLNGIKLKLMSLCDQMSVHNEAIGDEYSSLLLFLSALDNQIKRTTTKSSVKHQWLKQHREISKAVRTIMNEVATATFGRRQNLCLVPYHDVQNLSQNSLKAINMLKDLDLQLTTPKEFRPMLTHLAGDIIARLCNSLSGWAQDVHKVSIHFNLDLFKNQIPALYVDREEAERAISNLLVNSIKYSYPDESVHVEARRTSDSFFVDFVNKGIEILPDELEQLFVEGYRSPRAIPYASGDGFGLKIVKKIMQNHGGDVVVTHGKNPTVVSLKFPSFLATRRP